MPDLGNLFPNDRHSGASLLAGVILSVVGAGLTSHAATMLLGGFFLLIGLAVSLASWAVYRM